MNSIKTFFHNIIRRDTVESSKRLVALIVLIAIMYVVIGFTSIENCVSMLNSLLIFEAGLLGISSFEVISLEKNKAQKNEPKDS